jgi:hypothetical protein
MKTIAVILMMTMVMEATNAQNVLNGAWSMKDRGTEVVWTFVDGYSVQTLFDKTSKRFFSSWGGPYQIKGDELIVQTEFDTIDSLMVGKPSNAKFEVNGDKLTLDGRITFTRVDNGVAPLAGNWRITGRMQNGQMVEGPQGARKTLKILSGTRFQWVAINPELKGFYGTGGGTYTFANGKYTENIEFFSRDSTRVGASLTFDGKVEDGAWHHSGLNSRGEPLNEIWRRVK